jgi:DNA-binding LacI/PurR family transcriptional regulator
MRQNEEEMGRIAVENVLSLMNGQPVPHKVMLEAKLIPGCSTGPAAKNNRD